MTLSSLHQLLRHEVMDLYSAETQILEAMPKMIEAASSPKLQKALQLHQDQTKEQVKRLEKAAKALEVDVKGHECKGMKGLLAEAQDIIKMAGDPMVKDAALISAAQRVEHYEISGYGTAHEYATLLKVMPVKRALKKTLTEEKNTDKKLSQIAERNVNNKAMKKRDK